MLFGPDLFRACFNQVLGPLLVILLQGSLKLRLAAARLCERLLPQAPLEMVQVLALLAYLHVIRVIRQMSF